MKIANRPEYFKKNNGVKAPLPFSDAEYERRLAKLRKIMAVRDIPAILLKRFAESVNREGFPGAANCDSM